MTIAAYADSANDSQVDREPFVTRGVQKAHLPNGLTVITKELHDKPLVATMMWYRVGSRNEEVGQTGKSHFLEHMLFKGTNRYKKGEIDQITLRNGGANNAFTWLDYTAYYFTFASDRWEAALEIEANRMRHTTFAVEEFELEKRVVQEELRIGLDGPWEALENEVWATAFREHPYHWPTVGWLQDLESATAADMKAYYDKWYHPRNAVVVLAGDFNTGEALAKIERLFGHIPAGPETRPLTTIEPPQRGEKRVVVRRKTPVERLLIGYHAPPVGHPDSYALHVAENILSTGKASRLYRRLVEKDRSVTLARATFGDHIDPSLFYIQAELKPSFRPGDVERAILEEVERLKAQAVSLAEIEKAKRQIEADLVLSNEEPLHQAILLGQYETIAIAKHLPFASRGYKYLATMVDNIWAVTGDDLARAAREYLSEDNRTIGFLTDGQGSPPGSGLMREAQPHPSMAVRARVGKSAFRSDGPRAGSHSTADDSSAAARNRRSAGQGIHLDVKRLVLPNGLTLLISEKHSVPSVVINAVVRAGSRFEPGEKAGLASLIAEVLDEGTTTRSSEQIAEAIESVGGRIGTASDYQASGVMISLLAKDFAIGLSIAADLLINPAFPGDKVELHKERRAAQIKSRLDLPRVMASDVFNELVFKGTPQHRPSIGYLETVQRLTRDDVVSFHQRYYVPNNTIVAIVGDVDAHAVTSQVEDAFANWASAAGFRAPEVMKPVRQREPVQKFVTAEKEQVNIFVGHVGVERTNPDYYALLVMDTILGSSPGFTSRIPRVLRDEQGLAYSTFSNITSSAGIDPGRFVAYIGTAPQNLERAVAGIRAEIARIVREPVSADEVQAAVDYLTGNFVFDFQTNPQIAEFLIDTEVYGLGFDYLERYPEMIRAISADDVARVARRYLDPERLTTVVVGPVDASGKTIKKE
ncbi:MAG TPA: pitrilysin family protein [Blastocatellia bacterium]|nr:pitrilysin family protein [Blastocatellia bacterium]